MPNLDKKLHGPQSVGTCKRKPTTQAQNPPQLTPEAREARRRYQIEYWNRRAKREAYEEFPSKINDDELHTLTREELESELRMLRSANAVLKRAVLNMDAQLRAREKKSKIS